MDGGMTVAHACREMRLEIARIICLLQDEGMNDIAFEIEYVFDRIAYRGDTSREYFEYGELSTLKGHCMSVIFKSNKLAVLFYGKVDWRDP